jgi:hypothetical protein
MNRQFRQTLQSPYAMAAAALVSLSARCPRHQNITESYVPWVFGLKVLSATAAAVE